MEVNKSHIPGSLEYLEDDMDPTYKPIDALIYMHVSNQLEMAQFEYKGKPYALYEYAEDKAELPFYLCLNELNKELVILRQFKTFLDMLDTPSLHDGATIRQAFSTITGMDTRII